MVYTYTLLLCDTNASRLWQTWIVAPKYRLNIGFSHDLTVSTSLVRRVCTKCRINVAATPAARFPVGNNGVCFQNIPVFFWGIISPVECVKMAESRPRLPLFALAKVAVNSKNLPSGNVFLPIQNCRYCLQIQSFS